MHDITCDLKDGTSYCAPLWMWRPKEGWFSLVQLSKKDPEKIYFRDVKMLRGITRQTVNGEELVDYLRKARDEGWDGT